MKKMDLAYWKRVIWRLYDTFKEREIKLCGYDAAIGDGDHGTSMVHGFREAVAVLADTQASDIGALFQVVGHAFINSVGGVTGIIFGTMFLSVGRSIVEKKELSAEDLYLALFESLEAVKKIGKVKEGQKSMVDALAPAVLALQKAVQTGKSIGEALTMAHQAAREGMEATTDMEAMVGRGRYQTDKGIGHVDAGAASVAYIFEVFAAVY